MVRHLLEGAVGPSNGEVIVCVYALLLLRVLVASTFSSSGCCWCRPWGLPPLLLRRPWRTGVRRRLRAWSSCRMVRRCQPERSQSRHAPNLVQERYVLREGIVKKGPRRSSAFLHLLFLPLLGEVLRLVGQKKPSESKRTGNLEVLVEKLPATLFLCIRVHKRSSFARLFCGKWTFSDFAQSPALKGHSKAWYGSAVRPVAVATSSCGQCLWRTTCASSRRSPYCSRLCLALRSDCLLLCQGSVGHGTTINAPGTFRMPAIERPVVLHLQNATRWNLNDPDSVPLDKVLAVL